MKRKLRILHLYLRMTLANRKHSCTAAIGVKTKSEVEVNRFLILAAYCGGIPKRKNISVLRHVSSVRGFCVWFLSVIKDIPQRRYMRARKVTDNCQAGEEWKLF